MKTKGLFILVCLVLLVGTFSVSYAGLVPPDGEDLAEQGTKQLTCTIKDEAGNPISSANAGDVVQLHISHPSVSGPTRSFIFKVPSNSPDYKDTFIYSKYYSGTSSGGYTYMKINPYTYIEGTGVFIGVVKGHGYCYAILTIY